MKENKDYVRGRQCKDNYKYCPRGTKGVYIITHDITGQYYIGCSGNIGTRLVHHFSDLRRGTHANKNLQDLYDGSAYELFSYNYVEIEEEKMKQMELDFLNAYAGCPLILNSATRNNSWILNKNNEEQVKEWVKGVSKQASKRVGEANPFYGKKHTDSAKEKISKVHRGKEQKSCWKSVVVNGVIYKSLGEASERIGLHITTVSFRVQSENPLYINWYEYEGEVGVKDNRLLYEPSSKPRGLYSVNGKLYFTVKEIMEEHNVKNTTIYWRFKSKNFHDWIRLV